MKKLRFKEADVLDDQISEQNAPETTAIPATPEEVTQATENATTEVPPTEATPEPSYNEVTTPEGSADATPSEIAGGTDDVAMDSGVSVQPETVSVEVQIPTQQLGQAVAMATGDVRTAETAPDLEAEKQAQAEEAEAKDNLVVEQPMEQPMGGEEPMLGEPVAEEPAPIEEPQPVQESLVKEAIEIADEEDVAEDRGKMGASYRNLMRLNAEREEAELHESKDRFIDGMANLTDIEKEKVRMTFENYPKLEKEIDWRKAKDMSYAEFVKAFEQFRNGETLTEAVDLPKGSEDTEDLVKDEVEEIAEEDGLEAEKPKKGKLNFKALSADTPDDENPDLPNGFGEDEGIDYDDDFMRDFDDVGDSEEGIDLDFADRMSDVLGDKDADDLDTVADTLRATADYIDDYADEVEEDTEDEDFEDDEELEDNGEKLDFKSLLSDGDFDSEDTARVDYETDDEDVSDFKESMLRRMDEKRQSVNRYSETDRYFKNIPCEGDECEEPRRERKPYKFAKRHTPVARGMRESVNRKEDLVKRPTKKMQENIDFDSIIFPAGSENVANEYRDKYNDDLVSAHERVIESRKQAINDFHKSVRESRNRYSVPRRSYRESRDYEDSYRPRTNERFREALNSSVRTSRMNETSYNRNPSSWENNKAIDRFEESEKFNFKELLRNGYLG